MEQPGKNQTGRPAAGTEKTMLYPHLATLLSTSVAGEKRRRSGRPRLAACSSGTGIIVLERQQKLPQAHRALKLS